MLGAFVDRVKDLLVGMGGIDEEPQASRRFLDGWIKDRLHIHARINHSPRQLQSVQRVAGDDGDDGCLATVAGVEASLLGFR